MNPWRTKNETADDKNTKQQSRRFFSMSGSSSQPGANATTYPRILEDQELLDDNASSISDSKSSRPYEEDATSTSFHTAKSQESKSSLHDGQESHADSSSANFLSCREGSDRSDQCWTQLPVDVESNSGGFPERFSDLDEMSFHTCNRFNDQGLRSALSVPTAQNNGQFNIPLQVFAASIEKAAEERQAQRQRERLLWLPLRIFTGMVLVCSGIATIVWLSTRERTENDIRVEQRQSSPSLSPSWINSPSTVPMARSYAPFSGSNNSPTSSLPQLFGSLTSVTDSPTNLMSTGVLALDQTRPPSEVVRPPQDSSPMPIAPTLSPIIKSKAPKNQDSSAKDNDLPSITGLLGASSTVAPSAQPSMTPPLSAPPTVFWLETGGFVLIDQEDDGL